MHFNLRTATSFLLLFLKRHPHVHADTDADYHRTILEKDDNDHRYMVKFKHQSSYDRVVFKQKQDGDQRLIMTLPDDKAEVLTLNTTEEVLFWEQDDDVEYVEPDTKIYPQQDLETIPWGIEDVKALEVSDEKVSNQKVCIIDTGYDLNHPDLPTWSVSGLSQITDQEWSADGDGHGTHVAGTIAAIGGNKQGVVGVNRNGQLNLHIVKIFDNDGKWSSYKSDLIVAVQECVNAGSKIINMSLGGPNFSKTENDLYEKLYKEQNVILVASAGNLGTNAKYYPASYPSVMSVGAISSNFERASFSQYNDQVDIAAPGVSIKSTHTGGSYKTLSGTSMSSPHVAGVAALVWSHFPTLSAQEIREVLQSTAQDLGTSGRDDNYGHGLIRADLAYNFLVENYDDDDDDEGCIDSPNDWYDSDGPKFNCEWYAKEDDFCEKYGYSYRNQGKVAKEACCVCGGGIRDNVSTEVPVTAAPSDPSEDLARCGCDTCTSTILEQSFSESGLMLEEQIDWLIQFFDYDEEDACSLLCNIFLKGECDECNPLQCNA